MLTWSEGMTKAQNHYLSHSDFYNGLKEIQRPKLPYSEPATENELDELEVRENTHPRTLAF
jgi:hypothetical protein